MANVKRRNETLHECREENHDDCPIEIYVRYGTVIIECDCECHVEWQPDRNYEAGMAYASGYHD